MITYVQCAIKPISGQCYKEQFYQNSLTNFTK